MSMPLNSQPKFFSDGSYLACSRHTLKYLNVAIWPIACIQTYKNSSAPLAVFRLEECLANQTYLKAGSDSQPVGRHPQKRRLLVAGALSDDRAYSGPS